MKQKCSDLSKVKANANNTINMGQMIGLVNDGKHCELYLVFTYEDKLSLTFRCKSYLSLFLTL